MEGRRRFEKEVARGEQERARALVLACLLGRAAVRRVIARQHAVDVAGLDAQALSQSLPRRSGCDRERVCTMRMKLYGQNRPHLRNP